MYKKRKIMSIIVILLVTFVLTGCFGTDKVSEAELETKANGIIDNVESYYTNENLEGIANLLSELMLIASTTDE